MKRSLGSWSLVLILTFLAGLSSGAAQAALPPAIQARYVALSVMGYRYQVLFNSRGAPEARAKNLVAFAKTLPAVADARVLEDGLSVSGEFKDGIAFSFPYIYAAPSTPQPPKPATRGLSTTPTSGDQDPPTSLPLQPTQSESVANLVPITSISPSRQARVLYLAGTGGPGIRAAHELRDKLKAAGFEVPIPAGSASELPALRTVADDAVLYWNTHGGPDLFCIADVAEALDARLRIHHQPFARSVVRLPEQQLQRDVLPQREG